MLIAASHFWSDNLNAFIFGHSPMTPTLADVLMLTGLNISAPQTLSSFLTKPSHKLETKKVSGWKGYITHHSRSGPVTDREHVAFLTMWLEKFIFYGKTVGPTTSLQRIAELLAARNEVPLGQHLLGSVYFLLHQVSIKLEHSARFAPYHSPTLDIENIHNKITAYSVSIIIQPLKFYHHKLYVYLL